MKNYSGRILAKNIIQKQKERERVELYGWTNLLKSHFNRFKGISLIVFILFLSGLAFSAPDLSFANGGDQRIVDGKYMVNLSRAPFTPQVGDMTQMLASFVDLKTNKLVNEEITVKIRISKLGGGSGKKEFVYEQGNVKATGGILDFSYTFQDTGLHEIFFDFSLASNPEKIYKAPDFLLDIQKPEIERRSNSITPLGIVVGIVLGFIGGWITRKYFKTA